MDYVEAFKNLRTNNKYGRKSPHKAVLMLTVIEMYEKNILTDNEIYYDNKLKSLFLKVWNRVLPAEPLFHSEAYLPFWYLQSDSFWHIIPIRGKEDILSLMRDTNLKPSETKLNDSVKCAELDEDLYFLMTIPSGRSSLKRVLLESYTELSGWQIDRLAESEDNTVDHSIAAFSEYENILSNAKNEGNEALDQTDNELIRQFHRLNEDVQIVLNLEYFSFLKSHRNERDTFKEICPTVYVLYDHLVNHPIKQNEIAPSFVFVYENFLSDLKIALMSEDGAMELIDSIEKDFEILQGNGITNEECEIIETKEELVEEEETITEDVKEQEEADDANYVPLPEEVFISENRRGKPWTENEEELIALYFKQGKDFATIAEVIGRTEVSIKMRLAKLGLIEYEYGQEESPTTSRQDLNKISINLDDFTIENSYIRCSIRNKRGDKVFSAEGKLKRLNEKLYRLNQKKECFTIKDMKYDGSVWIRGDKKIVAYPESELYGVIEREVRYEDIIQDIKDGQSFADCKIKVSGIWYDNNGNIINKEQGLSSANLFKRSLDDIFTFVPKGKLKNISEVAEESYDFLLTMAVIEFMQFTPQPTIITFDRLACMMIAIAWEMLSEEESVREKEIDLHECIQFLMRESREEMSVILTWNSSKKDIFNAIKDYPMADVFEDTVDMLTEKAPYNVLRAWINSDNIDEIVRDSNTPSSTCLYGIHPMKRNPYVEVKQGWMRYLRNEHDNLMTYFKRLYQDYMI